MFKKILYFLLVLSLYIIIGMLVPFYPPHSVSQEFAKSIDTDEFYGSTAAPGPDRAGVIETNQDALDVRLAMIRDAREEIIITTFDIRSGSSVTDLFSALYDAAERGVDIKIIVDGMSGLVHMNTEPLFYAAGAHANIEFRYYNTPNPLLPWTIHGRMHDKYMIVDRKVLLAGGRNLFDYFLGTHEDIPVGQDREVLIYRAGTGASCIDTVLPYFEAMWNGKECRTVLDTVPFFVRKKAADCTSILPDHYAGLDIKAWDYETTTLPTNRITFITNPTHIYGKEPYIWEQLYQLMKTADRQVFIHTPYMVCSKEMYQGLTDLAANVPEMEVLVNSIASGDNLCASSDYRLNREHILETGVTLHEYMGASSTHGKSLFIDDDIAVIGSYNFDNRSTYVDTETMFVIHSTEVNQELKNKLNILKDGSLTVQADESYLPDDSVTPPQLPRLKHLIIRLLSFLIQPFRYLI